MAMLLAGIDEAGYGPMLGPLCVGLSVFRVADWQEGEPSPDLWSLLEPAVCREARDKRGRLPVADSKKLKLSNSLKTKHPLTHLERSVLSFLGARHDPTRLPEDDGELFGELGSVLPGRSWYERGAELPLARSADELAIDASTLRRAMREAGVELVALRCLVIDEGSFNEIVRTTGTKAEATLTAVGDHLRTACDLADAERLPLRIVCDRLGGRVGYGPLVARELPNTAVSPVSESPECCVYRAGEHARVMFTPEAEDKHLPVALASMGAKLVRELSMARFNRYWTDRIPELKPTAGYTTDARRWLRDAGDRIGREERTRMVRMA